MRRSLSGGRAACLYLADLFRLRRHRLEKLVCPLARMPRLRDESSSGPQRGEEHPMARTEPSGSPGVGWGVEPRTRGALAPAECQQIKRIRFDLLERVLAIRGPGDLMALELEITHDQLEVLGIIVGCQDLYLLGGHMSRISSLILQTMCLT